MPGEVVECFEFPEDGEIRGRAQRMFQRGQVGDRVAVEVGAEALGLEGGGAHNVRVPTLNPTWSEL